MMQLGWGLSIVLDHQQHFHGEVVSSAANGTFRSLLHFIEELPRCHFSKNQAWCETMQQCVCGTHLFS